MTDIVERLRRAAHNTSINEGFLQAQITTLFAEAAAEIERLRAGVVAAQKGYFDGDRIISDTAAKAAAAEREACAKIAEFYDEPDGRTNVSDLIAAAIRARTEGE